MSLSLHLPHYLLHPLASLPLPAFLRPSRLGPQRSLLLGLTLGFSLSLSLTGLALYALDAWKRALRKRAGRRVVEVRGEECVGGVEGLIGNTPLVRINSLSDRLGVEILGKCEYLNPFGSVKDRICLKIIQKAEEEGLIHPNTGSCIFEGTSGSTGISIAGIARARGYKAHIVLPDDVSLEKIQMLHLLGATVEPVRPVSIVDPRHYVNLARQRALEFGRETVWSTESGERAGGTPRSVSPHRGAGGGGGGAGAGDGGAGEADLLVTSEPAPRAPPIRPSSPSSSSSTPAPATAYTDPPRALFFNQFENLTNLVAHAEGTAEEIWQQTAGRVDGFVSGAGTGGTIAGVGRTLKKKSRGECEVVLADPMGSGLYHKIHDGVMYAPTESEGKRRRYQVDTIVEGIGLNRITKNLAQALPIIDDAYRVTDAEAVAMSRHLALSDGLFLGSSSAVNLVACVRLARKWNALAELEGGVGGGVGTGTAVGAGGGGERKRIVTILCDSGARHTSRFWNDSYLSTHSIPLSSSIDFLFSEPIPGLPSSPSIPSFKEGEETELASDDPRNLPPLPRELLATGEEREARGRRAKKGEGFALG